MIIDAHTHIGKSRISDLEITEDILCGEMDRCGIDMAILQSFPFPHHYSEGSIQQFHDEIADLAQKYPGRIYGMASINPHWSAEHYRKEADRCIRDMGFVGIKLHPLAHLAPITATCSDVVFKTASDLNVPVMIHTGFGVPFTLPALAIPRARQYPDLTIILAHAGESVYAGEALVAATECSNIFLETSWSQAGGIERFIQTLGAKRVMMGSDLPNNTRSELAKYESIDISADQRKQSLGITAREVFSLSINEDYNPGK